MEDNIGENNSITDEISEAVAIPAKKPFSLESDDLKKITKEEKSDRTIRLYEKHSVDEGLIETVAGLDQSKGCLKITSKTGKRRSVSFAAKARMRCDSHSGEVELNHSFTQEINGSGSKNNFTNKTVITPDMQMTVGLSVISKDDECEIPKSPKDIKIFHSTPVIKQKCENKPKLSVGKNLSICLVPNPNKKVIHDELPNPLEIIEQDEGNNISRTRRSSRKCESNCLSKASLKRDDKMIQVSKSIFGSSNDGTSYTVSKKKSEDFSTSYSYQEEIKETFQNKRKNGLSHSSSKKFRDEDGIVDSRTSDSEYISRLDTYSSFQENRNSRRRALRFLPASQYSTTDRINTSNSGYYSVIKNKKSVGFRDAVSLIEKSSNGFIDLNSISNKNDLKTHNLNSEMGSNSNVISSEKNNCTVSNLQQDHKTSSVVDEVDSNDISKECSLFKKLIQSAIESKKPVSNQRIKKSACSKAPRLRGNRKRNTKAYNNIKPYKMEKWVSHNLVKFLNNKLMNEQFDHIIKTEKIISILCSVENAVRNLYNSTDIEMTILPLKNVLSNYKVCTTLIEYSTFIMRFTPLEFQRKVLALGGYFRCVNSINGRTLSDPVLTQKEKDECCGINEIYSLNK